MPDPLANKLSPHSEYFTSAAAVTPDNDNDLANFGRALWVGGVGNIALTTLDGSEVTITAIAAGTLLPIRVKRVKATNTTATLIINLW